MLWVACAHDGSVAVWVGERVTQNELGSLHAFGKDFIEFRTRPDVVEGRSLDLGFGATVSDAATDDDTCAGFCGFADPITMCGSQARVGNLERVEDSQFKVLRQVGERRRDAYKSCKLLISNIAQCFDQFFNRCLIKIRIMQLQDIDLVCVEAL